MRCVRIGVLEGCCDGGGDDDFVGVVGDDVGDDVEDEELVL